MTDSTAPDLDEVRRRYETTDDRIQDICADAGLTLADLDRVRRRGGWRRQKPRPFLPAQRSKADGSVSPAPASPSPLGERVGVMGDDGAGGRDGGPSTPEPVALPALLADPDVDEAARLAERRRLLHRLVAAITLKLLQLERQMTSSLDAAAEAATTTGAPTTTATDHERETRAIGALIDNLEKIMEIESGLASPNGRRGHAASGAAADLADEAEQCRRELADRLSRIVEAAAGEA